MVLEVISTELASNLEKIIWIRVPVKVPVKKFCRSTCGVILSYAECLTTSRKRLILLAFEGSEAVRLWW